MNNCKTQREHHEYDPLEMDILYKIHEVSFRTALPIVIAVVKHVSVADQQLVSEDKIINDVKEDPLLKKVGCCIQDETIIREIIKNLVEQKFLERIETGPKLTKLKLTKCGNKAVDLLNLKSEGQS